MMNLKATQVLVGGVAASVIWIACGGSVETGTGQGSGGSILDASTEHHTGGANPGTGGSGTAGIGGMAGTGGSGTAGIGGMAGSGGSGGKAGSGIGGAAGSIPPWAQCAGPGWCGLETKGCCEPCGQATLDDVAGVSRAAGMSAAFRKDTCLMPDVPCLDCMGMGPGPNIAAFCVQHLCEAIDVRTDPVSSCESDSDCMIRYPDCCEQCGAPQPDSLIAISKGQASYFQQQICDATNPSTCPPCMPIYPDNFGAVCGADKHCAVAPMQCPSDVPSSHSACIGGQSCEYGHDLRSFCRTHATCEAGQWALTAGGCPPLPGAGEQGCPDTLDATGKDCPGLEGSICDMSLFGAGAMCVCDPCSVGGPCSEKGRWTCLAPTSTYGCPLVAPEAGQMCTVDELVACSYGVCGTASHAVRECLAGIWVDSTASASCPK